MQYLNLDRIHVLDPVAFQSQRPFPWINPEGILTDDGYRRLVETLPDVSLFQKSFGYQRKHKQDSHDRYLLEYSEDLPVATAWKEFITELRGGEYRAFLRRMLGIEHFDLNCHWHYAPSGCSVSPHCDARRKYGSHVFYFNTEQDWDPAWGGQTMVFDDKGRYSHSANPDFGEMECVAESVAIGNYSLLFRRGEHSWHGVNAVQCPEGRLRKVFILVVNHPTPLLRLKRRLGRLPKALQRVPEHA
jgi:hypothetical protein